MFLKNQRGFTNTPLKGKSFTKHDFFNDVTFKYEEDFLQNVDIREPVLPQLIEFRQKKLNKISNIAVLGETGDGKSFFGIRLCSHFDKTWYNPEIQKKKMIFNIFQSLDNCLKFKNTWLYIDEANLQNPFWANIETRIQSELVQSHRYKNINWVFILPHFHRLSKSIRENIHFIVTVFKNARGGVVAITYRHRVDTYTGVCWRRKLDIMPVELPDKQLIKIYESEREKYITKTKPDDWEDKLKKKFNIKPYVVRGATLLESFD
jgi:hypothetical protein